MRWIWVVPLLLGCRSSKPAAEPPAPVTACAAQIGQPTDSGRVYASWTEAWAILRGSDPDAWDLPPAPTSEEQARDYLCGAEACVGAGPWLLEKRYDEYSPAASTDLAFPLPDGTMRIHEGIGAGMGGHCGWGDTIEIASDTVVHVRVRHEMSNELEVDSTGEDLAACREDSEVCTLACFTTEVHEEDLFYEVGTGRAIFAIHRDATPAAGEFLLAEDYTFEVTVAREGNTITLAGGGCDQSLAL
jgi:hypothetical protein